MANGEKIEGGYVALSRKLLKSDVFTGHMLDFKMFLWMLLKANYKDGDTLKRGQLFTSIRKIREAMVYKDAQKTTHPTMKQVRTALDRLSGNLGMIQVAGFTLKNLGTANSTEKGTERGTEKGTSKWHDGVLITVLNYCKYQDFAKYGSSEQGTSTDLTFRQPLDEEGQLQKKGLSKEGSSKEIKETSRGAEGTLPEADASDDSPSSRAAEPPKLTPEEVQKETHRHLTQYTPKQLEKLEQFHRAMERARKSRKVAPNLFLWFLEECAKYPPNQVMLGLDRFFKGNHADKPTPEKYTIGIIHNITTFQLMRYEQEIAKEATKTEAQRIYDAYENYTT